MKQLVNYLETGSHDPAYNLAFEEYALRNCKDGDYLLLWQNDNAIIVGRNQNTEAEINREFVEQHNIKVIRRATGGGTVYHDLGNLNYSFITDVGEASELTMERFTTPVVEALSALGLHAEASGRNDILVDGKKVSGTAQQIIDGRILHHGTLLFDANPEMIANSLHVDPLKFQSKATKSVRSRVGNIRDFLVKDMDIQEFWDYLKRAFSGEIQYRTLDSSQLEEVEKLKREKYDQWSWNYGKTPQYTMNNKRRFAGGTLEISVHVKEGYIEDIVFRGDFLAVSPVEDVSACLRHVPYQREECEKLLREIEIQRYFGGISVQEILDTVFYANSQHA